MSGGEIVTCVRVTYGPAGGHDRVRVWNRHGLAGELVVQAGDGTSLAERLMPRTYDTAPVVKTRAGSDECTWTWAWGVP